jgi:HEAT repeat protein
LLDHLADPRLVADATDALARFGDSIVGKLRDQMTDPTTSWAVRCEITTLLGNIGTQSASQVLMEHLLSSDASFRLRILSASNNLHRRHPELKCDTQMVETALAAEILGHYRSYQILARLDKLPANDQAVGQALAESMKLEIERVFRLLELLYPYRDFSTAYIGLQSKSINVHDNALEFLDTVLKGQLRATLIPLLDGKVTATERASIADRLVPVRIENSEQAAAVLVASDDPWLRSCGAYAIGTLGLNSLFDDLNRCLADPDPLVRETARRAKASLEAAPGANG